jgi:hypothetical protein
VDPTALVIAAEGRAYPGEPVSGDGWTVDWYGETCRVALIDGLGHGAPAATVTGRAIETLAEHPDLAPDAAIRCCHRALAGSRGAAMAIASINLIQSRLSFAGVGNVEARLFCADAQQRPISYRGIVGVAIPSLRVFKFDLGADWLLLLHTDGVSSRFDGEELARLRRGEPRPLVEYLLQRWARATDDATAVAVRPAASIHETAWRPRASSGCRAGGADRPPRPARG